LPFSSVSFAIRRPSAIRGESYRLKDNERAGFIEARQEEWPWSRTIADSCFVVQQCPRPSVRTLAGRSKRFVYSTLISSWPVRFARLRMRIGRGLETMLSLKFTSAPDNNAVEPAFEPAWTMGSFA
jgi:hypothetical protein